MSFVRLVAGERRKITGSWMLPGLAVAAVVLAQLTVVLPLALADATPAPGERGISLADPDTVRGILTSGAGGFASLFAVVIGVIVITTEYRHSTITAAFLGEPRRWPLLAAKLVATLVFGAVIAAAATAVALAIAVPWLDAKGVDAGLGDAATWRAIGGAVLSLGLWGAFGVAVGALIRNQIAAIVVALGWLLVAENIIGGFFPKVGRFLPSGAASALVFSSGDYVLSWWAGLGVMLAYVVGFSVIAAVTTLRSDVH